MPAVFGKVIHKTDVVPFHGGCFFHFTLFDGFAETRVVAFDALCGIFFDKIQLNDTYEIFNIMLRESNYSSAFEVQLHLFSRIEKVILPYDIRVPKHDKLLKIKEILECPYSIVSTMGTCQEAGEIITAWTGTQFQVIRLVDHTGSITLKIWDTSRMGLVKPGDVIIIEKVLKKKYNGVFELNLNVGDKLTIHENLNIDNNLKQRYLKYNYDINNVKLSLDSEINSLQIKRGIFSL